MPSGVRAQDPFVHGGVEQGGDQAVAAGVGAVGGRDADLRVDEPDR
jgi:hypothetical protein